MCHNQPLVPDKPLGTPEISKIGPVEYSLEIFMQKKHLSSIDIWSYTAILRTIHNRFCSREGEIRICCLYYISRLQIPVL